MTYGYVRVSSKEQNEDRQLIAMYEYGIPKKNIFIDKQSGKDFKRPSYMKLIHKLQRDDLLVILSIDRLGRNYDDMQKEWRIITKEIGADVYIIDMPILDTRCEKNLLGTLISDLVLALLSYVAENERHNIHTRQAEGIKAAKLRGVKFGRKPLPLPDNFDLVYHKWKIGKITVAEAAKECGMAKTTFYDKAKKYGQNNKA